MKKITRILVPMLLGLLIIVSIFWYLFVYDRTFTRDTLLGQARYQDMHGNSRISSWFYKAAYSFSGQDEDVAIELAHQYESDGNFTKAEYTLTNAINTYASADLYVALCRTYVRQDKLLDAVNMLDNIRDPELKAKLDDMRPSAPAADYAPGFYSQYMDIHLSSGAPTIYYTMDGTYPSIAGTSYDSSVTLPTGETTLYAIAVDDKGMVSPVTVLSYTISGIIEPAVFSDPIMEAAMRQLIGAEAEDQVLTNELWEITEFTVPEGTVNYSDLALMPYLKKLTIQDKVLDSFESLSTLGALQELDLTASRFPSDSLTILAELPSLTRLTLADCNLSTIAGLADAPHLTYLDLSHNTIRNLEVLAPMTSLTEINLDHNAVTDLTAISGLPKLETVKVSYNSLVDLEELGNCLTLRHIEADHNQLNTLRGLHQLPLLEQLSVNHNNLTHLDRLEEAGEMVSLSVASNDISDLTPLSGMTKLEVLDFSSNRVEFLPTWPDDCALQTIDGSYNQLTSLEPLANLQKLSHVYMDYNLLTNVDALENCYCLVQVNVYGNEIPDVEKLRDHDIIVNYDPTYRVRED